MFQRLRRRRPLLDVQRDHKADDHPGQRRVYPGLEDSYPQHGPTIMYSEVLPTPRQFITASSTVAAAATPSATIDTSWV